MDYEWVFSCLLQINFKYTQVKKTKCNFLIEEQFFVFSSERKVERKICAEHYDCLMRKDEFSFLVSSMVIHYTIIYVCLGLAHRTEGDVKLIFAYSLFMDEQRLPECNTISIMFFCLSSLPIARFGFASLTVLWLIYNKNLSELWSKQQASKQKKLRNISNSWIPFEIGIGIY